MIRALSAVVVLVSCGRVHFDPVPDAAQDAMPCPSFALFCDGFETGDVSRWTSTDIQAGTLSAQSAIVHTGRFALDADLPTTSTNGLADDVGLDTATMNTGMVSVREWTYAPEQLTNFDAVIHLGGTTHFTNLAVTGNLVWDATEDSPGGGLVDHPSTIVASPGVWTCVELAIQFVPPAVTVYINDQETETVAMADQAPVYSLVSVGLPRGDIAGAHVIVDDVVVATQHIGCE